MTVWEQLVFGKLVVSEDGPIVPGVDHRCTGLSQGFPRDLVRKCHPSSLGLGSTDLYDWHTYPWLKEGGGIVSQVLLSSESGPWRIIGKIRARSELSSKDMGGRFFIQAHYIAAPWLSWSKADLLSLPHILTPEPMLNTDFDLPQITKEQPRPTLSLSSDKVKLRDNLISLIFTNKQIKISDNTISINDALNLIFNTVNHLPMIYFSSFSFGIGLIDIDKNFDVAIGLGQVGGNTMLSDLEMSESSNVSQESHFYLNKAKEISARELEFDDVGHEIDKLLSEVNIYNSKLTSPFENAAGELIKVVRQWRMIELLDRSLSSTNSGISIENLDLRAIDLPREKIIQLLFMSLPRSLIIIDQTFGWQQEWQEFSSFESRALSDIQHSILILFQRQNKKTTEAIEILKYIDIQKSIVEILTSQLERSDAYENNRNALLHSLKTDRDCKDWFAAWRSRLGPAACAAALKQYRHSGSLDVFESIADIDSCKAVVSVVSGSLSNEVDTDLEAIKAILKLLTEDDVVFVIERALDQGYFRIAGRIFLGLETDVYGKRFHKQRLLRLGEKVAPAIAQIGIEQPEFLRSDAGAVDSLLRGWERVDLPTRDRLGPLICDLIGQPYAAILISSDDAPTGAKRGYRQDVAAKILSEPRCQNVNMIWNFIRLHRDSAIEEKSEIFAVLRRAIRSMIFKNGNIDLARSEIQRDFTLLFLFAIWNDDCLLDEKIINEADFQLIRKIVIFTNDLNALNEISNIENDPHTVLQYFKKCVGTGETNRGIAFWRRSDNTKVPAKSIKIPATYLAKIIQRVDIDKRDMKQWISILTELKIDTSDGWRLISSKSWTDLSNFEKNVIDSMSPSYRLLRVAEGWPVDRAVIDGIRPEAFSEAESVGNRHRLNDIVNGLIEHNANQLLVKYLIWYLEGEKLRYDQSAGHPLRPTITERPFVEKLFKSFRRSDSVDKDFGPLEKRAFEKLSKSEKRSVLGGFF